MRRLPAFLLVANSAYLLLLPSTSGKILSGIGCIVALALLIASMPWTRASKAAGREPASMSPASLVVPIVAFAIPALAFLRLSLNVAFWRLDARALIILAWLAVAVWLLALAHRGERERSLQSLTMLFVLWSGLFWLMLVWDAGVGRVVLGNLREDRISLTFELWRTRPASEHLFLAWLTRDDFARHQAYTNHLHPYLFFMYGSTKAVQLLTGLPLAVGRNATAFVVAAIGVFAFAALLLRSPRISKGRGLTFYATLFLMVGFFVSESHYWTSLYSTNIDSAFPLFVYLAALVWAAAQPRITRRHAVPLIAAAALFGAFGWIYTPLLIAALWCCCGRPLGTSARISTRNRVLAGASAAAALACAVAYGVPRLLTAVKGYTSADSTLLFRSGLDGDTAYFHDVMQAVLRPYWGPARTWPELLYPAFVPLLVCAICVTFATRAARWRLSSQLMFLWSLYLCSLALSPQSVSIHPYLYDQLLFLPAVLTGAVWSLAPDVQRRLRGPYLLGAALLAALLISANFIAIAQAMKKTLPI